MTDSATRRSQFKRSSSYGSQKRYCGGRLSRRGFMYVVCGLTTFATLAVVGLLVLFLGGKVIARASVNASQIQIDDMHIMGHEMRGDMVEAVHTRFSMSIINNFPMSADIEEGPFELKHDGHSFAQVMMPAFILDGSAFNKFNFETDMLIIDQNRFSEFCHKALTDKDVVLQIVGKVSISASIFPTFTGIDFNKMVQLSGFNKFSVFEPKVLSQKFAESDADSSDALTVVTSLELQNQSSFTLLSIGQVEGDIYLNGEVVAQAKSVGNVKVDKKNNVLDLTMLFKSSNGQVKNLLTSYFNGEDATLVFKGTRSSDNMWNDVVSAITLEFTFLAAAHGQEKFFQNINQLLDVSPSVAYAQPSNDERVYCKNVVEVPDFTGAVVHKSLHQDTGRVGKIDILMSNNMDIDIAISDFDMTVSVLDADITDTDAVREGKYVTYGRFASFGKFFPFEQIDISHNNITMLPVEWCLENQLYAADGTIAEGTTLGIFSKNFHSFLEETNFFSNPTLGSIGSSAEDLIKSKIPQVSAPATFAQLEGHFSFSYKDFIVRDIPLVQKDVPFIARMVSSG